MAIDESAIEAAVQQHMASAPFSGVVLVHERGQTIFARAYGLAQRSEALPNTLATRFATASGSKTFTAVAVCQLVARGLLTLDTPLAACVAVPFPTFDPAVTIHHLLTHTSGIPDYFDEDIMDDYAALWHDLPVYRMRSPADFLPLFQSKPMLFAPGTRFHYNNAGFVVLAMVVEHITGLPFHDYVTKEVFQASGMTNSGYFATDQLPPHTAYGYIEDEESDTWHTNFFAVPVIGGGDGGAYVTAADMIAFWTALLGNRFFPEQVTQTMLKPHAHVEDQFAYGYGLWMMRTANDAMKYMMTGGDPGVTFSSRCYPDGVQVVALGNTSSGASALVNAIEKVILKV